MNLSGNMGLILVMEETGGNHMVTLDLTIAPTGPRLFRRTRRGCR
jgi:hypothetical protein